MKEIQRFHASNTFVHCFEVKFIIFPTINQSMSGQNLINFIIIEIIKFLFFILLFFLLLLIFTKHLLCSFFLLLDRFYWTLLLFVFFCLSLLLPFFVPLLFLFCLTLMLRIFCFFVGLCFYETIKQNSNEQVK